MKFPFKNLKHKLMRQTSHASSGVVTADKHSSGALSREGSTAMSGSTNDDDDAGGEDYSPATQNGSDSDLSHKLVEDELQEPVVTVAQSWEGVDDNTAQQQAEEEPILEEAVASEGERICVIPYTVCL
jgi:hypothetical protein